MSEVAVSIESNGYSENVVNKTLGLVNPFSFTINSGTGSAVMQEASVYQASSVKVFSGNRSLKITSTDFQNTDLVFSNSDDAYSFQSDTPKTYCLSMFFYLPSGLINTNFKVEIFQDGSPYEELIFELKSASTMPLTENWYRMGQNVYFDSAFVYTFKYTLVKEPTHATNSVTVYVGGYAIQCLNKGTQEYSAYQMPKDFVLQTTEVIDVPNIVNGTTATVTATLTGAMVGDFVQMTEPVALINAGLEVGKAVVTTDDTIKFTIRNNTGGDVNPASGNYAFKILR